ncbi:Chloride channel protein CLC-e [Apostasia shenzhenica]|uniref:Chloride channel protein n=1 Tax=Apostasia shenzhenica TaxID=1088818 RepID=A0A2I0A6E8_9ASPA|nr:Chloride channel protein CLC-e [Apostasia shenzhenica]
MVSAAGGYCSGSRICCASSPESALGISHDHYSWSASSKVLVAHCRPASRRRRGSILFRFSSSSTLSASNSNSPPSSGAVTARSAGRREGTADAVEGDEESRNRGAELGASGREDAAGPSQDAGSGVATAIEESLPAKDLITLASCLVGLLTGVGVVLFNEAVSILRSSLFILLSLLHILSLFQSVPCFLTFGGLRLAPRLCSVHEIREFFWDGIPSRGTSWLREEPLEEICQRAILVPTCGGLLVGMLNSFRGYLESSSWRNRNSNIKAVLSSFVKAIAASFTLGTGNSLGPEGPSVEIGSSIAKGVGHAFRWNGGKNLSIVAAGSAAGISSGFNAAVSGCFFAVESVLWPSPDSLSSLTNSTSMVILSSVIASIVSEVGLGSNPTFTVPDYDFRSPSELPLYLLLGVLCGFVSLTLSQCTSFALKAADNFRMAIGISTVIFPALGGLTVGLIALAYPEVLYWGFQNIDILLESHPFVNGLPAGVLLQLVGVKIVATSISRASGLVGGYYAPSLFIGAATGMAYGKFVGSTFFGPDALFNVPILDVASPQAYGLVGMAATLAGVCQVPLTSVLLLFELTQDYRIVLPLLGAVGLSSWIASNQNKKRKSEDKSDELDGGSNGLGASPNRSYEFYYSTIAQEVQQSDELCELESSLCVYDHGVSTSDWAEKLTVSHAMRTKYITVQMNDKISDVIKIMLEEKQSCSFVTDSSNFLVGQLSLEDIQDYSRSTQAYVTKTNAVELLVSDICQRGGSKKPLWTAAPTMTLAAAERLMNFHGFEKKSCGLG